jgi:hypothetical protein
MVEGKPLEAIYLRQLSTLNKEKRMSDNTTVFMPGDAVFYVGERHKQELTREGKPIKGWIHAAVLNEPGNYVVEFPDAKEPDYIMSVRVLSRARPSKTEKHDGPEVQPRRRKKSEEETAQS